MTKWYEIYPKLARLLSEFSNKNKGHEGEVLYKIIRKQNSLFKNSQWYLRTLKVVKEPGIDPIQIFSSFNQAKQSNDQRKLIINTLFRILGSKQKYDDIDFDGCPCPFSLKLMSFRDLEIQSQIWETFNHIINLKQDALTEDIFQQLKRWYGLDVVSFTIFLFWIDPRNFLSLDKNNQIILYEAGVIKTVPKKYPEYRNLLVRKNSDLYIEIAKNSFLFSHGKKPDKLDIQRLRQTFRGKKLFTGGQFDFKIIALQPLEGIFKKHIKILKPKIIYSFYSDYIFRPDGKIQYDETKRLDLYSNGNININVSAIAGKNGSGKSTISELMFLAINNIAFKILSSNNKSDLTHEKGVNLSLFYQAGTFCKITLQGKKIRVTEYEYKQGFYFPKRSKTSLSEIELAEMFYTIAINYSHYSLNSNELGDWINNLFHKNDGYQTPLVINPFRKEGNFDINREDELAKARLLANVLQRVDVNDISNLRVITEKNQYLKSVCFSYHEKKIKKLNDEKYKSEDFIFKTFVDYHAIKVQKISVELLRLIKKYLASKLHKICNTYEPYKIFLRTKSSLIDERQIPTLIEKIENDSSHITYKIKQVKNFLKYEIYRLIKVGKKTALDSLSISIEEFQSLESKERPVKTIEFIPPSFYDFDLFLDNNSDFNKLSSGEKQRIYTVSAIVYHLNNINSVTEENNFITYPLVNIIFDEIELYFHPEMQRKFISYLLNYLNRADLDNIVALNFCFITHSPFILSDIPTQNILFLSEDGFPDKSLYETKTFGGNIHDLLANNFFLSDKGFMGEFAKIKINSVIKFLENTSETLKESETLTKWNESLAKKFIDIVGEPLISESLLDLYFGKFKTKNITEIDREIDRLQKLKLELS